MVCLYIFLKKILFINDDLKNESSFFLGPWVERLNCFLPVSWEEMVGGEGNFFVQIMLNGKRKNEGDFY